MNAGDILLVAGKGHEKTQDVGKNKIYFSDRKVILNAIKNNSNPEVSLDDGLIAVAVGEAAEKSIKLKRLVKLEEIY